MQQRSEETRARIRAAALDLFSQHGYDATGVAAICQAAGVSKGAFYHHYPTKHAVFFDLLELWLGELDEQLDRIPRDPGGVPAAFTALGGMLGRVFADAGGRLPMFLEFWTQSSRDPQVWQATIAPYRRYGERFEALIQRGIDEGSFRPVDPAAASRVILALGAGLLLSSLLDPSADWDTAAGEGMRIFMGGLAANSLPPGEGI